MGLVAENIALICNAHAQSAGVSTIVYGGSTLCENPSLIQTVQVLTRVLGREALVLPESGHAGALGAMLLGR
jgi:pantothenate kinase